ncbi:MAG: hypothetical protein LBG76_07980 [Treponema sp.]|jgi:hypothetical protein|nr:hypothetical protein [Treponema sp.]
MVKQGIGGSFAGSVSLGLIIFLAVCGCMTTMPKPEIIERTVPNNITVVDHRIPLTIPVIERLDKLEKCQLYLFGGFELERQLTPRPSEPNTEIGAEGRVTLSYSNVREVKILEDQLPGQAIKYDRGRREIFVCFDTEDTNNSLIFSNENGDPDGFFYLQYAPDRGSPPADGGKGTLEYGGKSYRVKFSGDKPFLLIKLSLINSDK